MTNCNIDAKSISMNTKEANTLSLSNQCDTSAGNALFPGQGRTSDPKFDTLVPAKTKASDETEELLVLE